MHESIERLDEPVPEKESAEFAAASPHPVASDPDSDLAAENDSVGAEDRLDSPAQEQADPVLQYPVVGIGASAGGLQALQVLLKHLSPSSGMAFVLVSHLAPDQKSYLTEILAQSTEMPVIPIVHGDRPVPDHFYVLLPNQFVTLDHGLFRVEARPLGARHIMPIDLFFRSLAAEQKNFAIGVVLSGADADGASGLKAIKGDGGIALVQAPETATHGSMPRSSIAADHVDLIVPPAQLGSELERLSRQFVRTGLKAFEEGPVSQSEEQQFRKILRLLRTVSNIDFQHYKPATLRRRIARRMVLQRMEKLEDYARHLQVHPEELRLLQEDALINVTRFFRDPSLWSSLTSEILPSFFKDRPVADPIRIWCAGCSSGEEVYSLAMCFLEFLSERQMDTPIQIFGTDASERSIEMARTGIYPESLTAELSPDRMRRYFVKVDRGYQVAKRVRDLCIFARQNLGADPPFSHIDFVSCRNVLIYFDQSLQHRVVGTLHYALEPAGHLILGSSESLREYTEMFAAVDIRNKIYCKIGARVLHGFHIAPYFSNSGKAPALLEERALSAWPELDLQHAADRIVLGRHGPAGLIVDEHLNVLQSRGDTAPFIEIGAGAVSWNLFRVLRAAIASHIRPAIERAIAESVPVSADPVRILVGEMEKMVRAEVLPIATVTGRARCFLILFQDVGHNENNGEANQQSPVPRSADEKEGVILQLREDLSASRFHLQTLIEERDARNQELVSANEEIQSANEELQSTNEEVETTKEELQSANEELQTVNDELQQRNSGLIQTGNDLNNLLNSVNLPLLMLNSDLQIRQFTPAMQKVLGVRPSDVGRSINDIRLHLSVEDLDPLLRQVLETLAPRELEVQDRKGEWYSLQIRPYRTSENKIEGLVVVLLPIDHLRRRQQQLMGARDFADSILENAPLAMVVLDQNLSIRRVNAAFRELAQMTAQDLAGRPFADFAEQVWGIDSLADSLGKMQQTDAGTILTLERASGKHYEKSVRIQGQTILTDGDQAILLTLEDITSVKARDESEAAKQAELQKQIAMAAETLDRTQEELRSLTGHLFQVQEEERQRVARELHDDISQKLSVLDLELRDLQKGSSDKRPQDRIEELRSQLSGLSDDVRRISHRLHPAILDDLGLPAALKALVEDFGEREQMPADFASRALPDSIPRTASAALYRIAQEALRNISKHAGKTHVKVVLEGTGGSLRMQVMDFGIGFDQEAGFGLGLISMKERARLAQGAFSVNSELGAGTTVTVEVPLSEIEQHA